KVVKATSGGHSVGEPADSRPASSVWAAWGANRPGALSRTGDARNGKRAATAGGGPFPGQWWSRRKLALQAALAPASARRLAGTRPRAGAVSCPVRPRVRSGRGFDSAAHTTKERKRAARLGRPFRAQWWSRRESNPRPQVLYDQFYMRSRSIWISMQA